MLNSLKHSQPTAEPLLARADGPAVIAAAHADAVDAERAFRTKR